MTQALSSYFAISPKPVDQNQSLIMESKFQAANEIVKF